MHIEYKIATNNIMQLSLYNSKIKISFQLTLIEDKMTKDKNNILIKSFMSKYNIHRM